MIKNVLYITGGNVFRQALTFIAQIVLARNLGEVAFGDLTLAFSVFLIMAGIGDMGTRLYAWRSVAVMPPQDRDREVMRLFIMRMKLTLMMALILNLAIAFAAQGRVALLLHLYTGAILVNQAAFDWVLLSRERYRENFWFTVISGLIYLGGIVMLVRSVDRVYLVPPLLAASFAVPGLALLWRDLRMATWGDRGMGTSIAEIIQMVKGNGSLLAYDLLQRTSAVIIIVAAAWYYGPEDLARFRVPHLIFTFVGALGIYVASSVFNRVAQDSARSIDSHGISNGTILILCLFLPAGFILDRVLAFPLGAYLGPGYQASIDVLGYLMVFVPIAALANFAREVAVSAGGKRLGMASYLVTILGVLLGLVLFHSPGIISLAVVLVVAEAAGLAVVVARRLRSYLRPDVLGVAALSLAVGLGLDAVWPLIEGGAGAGTVGWAVASGVSLLVVVLYALSIIMRTGLGFADSR